MRRRACQNCGKLITKGRKDKKFCSEACRYTYWRDNPGKLPPCYYCGFPADTIDHVPPISARSRLSELGLSPRYPNSEIDACTECNCVLLGSRPIWTLTERKLFIKKALQKKYRKVLKMKQFTDSELSQFGYNLRTSTISKAVLAEIIRSRLAW